MIALLLSPLAFAIPQETVLNNAALYASHRWSSASDNQFATCTDGDYESDYPPGDYVGLPYDWGGYMSLDTFDAQIADGYGAGSHSWHDVLSCTAGVDCSGFLSMIWETDHYATSTFADGPTHEIPWSAITRGDAVNDPGSHVVLYTHETDAGWPVFYEASGSAKRVRINASGGYSYLDGYQPIRFDSITEGATTGTAGAPIEITAFPFSDFRWTAGAASDVIDAYNCASGADESGPEVLYHFEAATSGTLAVVVSDDVGIDVDIHVLTRADGDHCLARNDTEVELEVGPGEIWLAVDTYVSGDEFPGPYILAATFDGRLGEADPTPADDTGLADSGAPEDTDDPSDLGRDRPDLRRLDEVAGCGCAGSPGAPGSLGLVALGFALARGRRRPPGQALAAAARRAALV